MRKERIEEKYKREMAVRGKNRKKHQHLNVTRHSRSRKTREDQGKL